MQTVADQPSSIPKSAVIYHGIVPCIANSVPAYKSTQFSTYKAHWVVTQFVGSIDEKKSLNGRTVNTKDGSYAYTIFW